ncbi:MAG: type IX secretion system protein PorQ [Bacteroidota bacterium]
MNLLYLKTVNRNIKQIPVILLFVLITADLFGQSSQSFTSLQQPAFAGIAGLGGVNASLMKGGQGYFLYNPALLREELNNNLALSYGFLPGGANLSNINYSFNIDELGSFGAGIQYVAYGTIQGYDNTGSPTVEFSPADFTISATHARQANNFRLGATIKFSNTSISGYNGNALMFDLGGVFIHPEKEFTVGMVVRNLGIVTSEFSSTSKTDLPFDVQLGTSIKPEHLSVRFSLTLHKLHKWDLMYEEPEIHTLNTTLDNMFRHVVVGAEIIINDHVSILAGYNQLRRQELKLENRGGFSGFSIGTAISIKNFNLDYAYGGYHVSGNTNTFTLSADLSQIKLKK